MAKPVAPLFGFGASGQLGKALVYGRWKGIDVARRYVVPANPQSTAQVTQRGYMSAAVAGWHVQGGFDLLGADIEAWNRYAGVLGRMTGFNAFVRSWVNEAVAGGTVPGSWRAVIVTDPSHASMDVTADMDVGGTPTATLHIGVTKTFFPIEATDAMGSGQAVFANVNTGFPAGTKVYFWVEVGTPGADYARSGLYTTTLT